MGIEIVIDSLEDMCALMCDNVVRYNKPKRRKNMIETIDNAKDAIKEIYYIRSDYNPLSNQYAALSMAIEALEQETAHWITHPKGIYAHLVCSKCLSNAPYDCETNYCPNCGRRMVPEK